VSRLRRRRAGHARRSGRAHPRRGLRDRRGHAPGVRAPRDPVPGATSIMDQSAYGLHAETEERHWWFAARRKIVRAVLASLELRAGARLIEFGSGTGGNLGMLGGFGAVTALEPNDEARAIAAARWPDAAHVAALDALDGAARFDAALALDVIEHLDAPA